MLSIKHAIKSDRTMKAVLGITIKEFNALLPKFTQQYEEDRVEKEKAEGRKRKRAVGGGRKGVLKTAREKLFYILFYYKCYMTFDVLSVCFGFGRGHSCEWVHRLSPILTRTLGKELVLPERKIRSFIAFLELFPEAKEIFIDGTERPRRRPQDSEDQKKYYSGKKKRHTIKNLVVTDKKKRIKVLTQTYEGKKHDYSICKQERLPQKIPKWATCYVDLGFEGIEKDYPKLRVMKPKKKPRKKELPKQDKERNTALSSVRILVEHAIGGAKRFNILAQSFRNIKAGFDDQVMLNSCGLWNYHLEGMIAAEG